MKIKHELADLLWFWAQNNFSCQFVVFLPPDCFFFLRIFCTSLIAYVGLLIVPKKNNISRSLSLSTLSPVKSTHFNRIDRIRSEIRLSYLQQIDITNKYSQWIYSNDRETLNWYSMIFRYTWYSCERSMYFFHSPRVVIFSNDPPVFFYCIICHFFVIIVRVTSSI